MFLSDWIQPVYYSSGEPSWMDTAAFWLKLYDAKYDDIQLELSIY